MRHFASFALAIVLGASTAVAQQVDTETRAGTAHIARCAEHAAIAGEDRPGRANAARWQLGGRQWLPQTCL